MIYSEFLEENKFYVMFIERKLLSCILVFIIFLGELMCYRVIVIVVLGLFWNTWNRNIGGIFYIGGGFWWIKLWEFFLV